MSALHSQAAAAAVAVLLLASIASVQGLVVVRTFAWAPNIQQPKQVYVGLHLHFPCILACWCN
jgi:hypothetical protein